MAACIKRTTKQCYTLNMKALGLAVLKDFLCFSHDAPGAWPVPLYIATHKIGKLWALRFWRRRFFLCFAHCKSMGANDPEGRGHF